MCAVCCPSSYNQPTELATPRQISSWLLGLLTNHGWVGRQQGAAIGAAGWRLAPQRRLSVLPGRLACTLPLAAQPQGAATGAPPPLLLPPRWRAAATRLHILRQQRQVAIRLLVLAVLALIVTVHCGREECMMQEQS